MIAVVLLLFAGVPGPSEPAPAYVGDEPCSVCHESEFQSFRRTAMGRTIGRPGGDDVLAGLAGTTEFYSPQVDRHYSVFRRGDRYFHRETQKDSDGRLLYSAEEALSHAVGSGLNGFSYLLRRGDRLYMSPLTYYTRKTRWDLSPGYARGTFSSFSRPVTVECLVCHSGRPNPVPGTVNAYRDPPFLSLHIGCERCHGPGSEHVERAGDGETDPSKLAIVNPARLTGTLRDNICDQCHLRGDARVLRPGKTHLDFRAGEPLDETVAVFSVPLEYQGEAFSGISQGERMRASRCWEESRGALGCISCHNPHAEPEPEQRADHYRRSCLGCHQQESCAAPPESRQSTDPPDDCISCHMPASPLEGVPHSIGTDHRISRFPPKSPASLDELKDRPGGELKHLTGSELTTRTKALAYAQVARFYTQYRQEGFRLLQQAIREYPDDLDLNETLGLIRLRVSQSGESLAAAALLLQKAVDLGSASGVVHHNLARIRLRQGQVQAAVELLRKGIEFEPHHSPASALLAEIYLRSGYPDQARKVAEGALAYNPGDAELRRMLEQVSGDSKSPR